MWVNAVRIVEVSLKLFLKLLKLSSSFSETLFKFHLLFVG